MNLFIVSLASCSLLSAVVIFNTCPKDQTSVPGNDPLFLTITNFRLRNERETRATALHPFLRIWIFHKIWINVAIH